MNVPKVLSNNRVNDSTLALHPDSSLPDNRVAIHV